jgi:hypothetical protein
VINHWLDRLVGSRRHIPRLRIVTASIALLPAADCGSDSETAVPACAPSPASVPADLAEVQANEFGTILVLQSPSDRSGFDSGVRPRFRRFPAELVTRPR